MAFGSDGDHAVERTMWTGNTSAMAQRRARLCSACVLVLGVAMGAVPSTAAADDIRIARGDCRHPVHLVAREARLSSVLKKLAESLHFIVVYQSQTDPLVTTDARSPATDLVRTLARNMNFSLEEATDVHCAQGRRIAKLSVLPDPPGGNRAAVASARPAWMTPEMERIGKLGMQDYLQSHGIPGQPTEEPTVH